MKSLNSRNILHILILLSFIGCKTEDKKSNDLIALELNGNVKSIVELSYPQLSKKWDNKDTEYLFNKKGFVLKKINFRRNRYTVYNYNESEKFINSNIYSLNDSLLFTSDLVYNTNNELVKLNVFNSEKKIVYYTIYEYSKTSNDNVLVTEKEYDSKGKLTNHTSKVLNSKKEVILRNIYDLKSKKIFVHDLSYNENGKLIESVKYDSLKNIEWKLKMSYNSNNLESEKRLYIPKIKKENIWKIEYEFDNRNNWVKKYLIENKDTVKTIERKIIYFE